MNFSFMGNLRATLEVDANWSRGSPLYDYRLVLKVPDVDVCRVRNGQQALAKVVELWNSTRTSQISPTQVMHAYDPEHMDWENPAVQQVFAMWHYGDVIEIANEEYVMLLDDEGDPMFVPHSLEWWVDPYGITQKAAQECVANGWADIISRREEVVKGGQVKEYIRLQPQQTTWAQRVVTYYSKPSDSFPITGIREMGQVHEMPDPLVAAMCRQLYEEMHSEFIREKVAALFRGVHFDIAQIGDVFTDEYVQEYFDLFVQEGFAPIFTTHGVGKRWYLVRLPTEDAKKQVYIPTWIDMRPRIEEILTRFKENHGMDFVVTSNSF